MKFKANYEIWDLRPHRMEIVGRDATLDAAIRGCRGDDGRTLTIYDSFGRIAAMMRDGKLLTDTVTPTSHGNDAFNEAEPADAPESVLDPEVDRIVTALRNSTYQRTAEHVLDAEPSVVDKAIKLGLIRVVKVQPTTYNRKGERMLAAA